MQKKDFWDNFYSEEYKLERDHHIQVEIPGFFFPALKSALKHFGDIKDKSIIDLGCGSGATSLFFAHHGANVISIDSSSIAISRLSKYCDENLIRNIEPIRLAAQDILSLGKKVDLVFGSMILHHIEPFKKFTITLRDSIKQGGKGFFWENNARSKVMIWFRQNIVGKLWVPKQGDQHEYPLTPNEIDKLRKVFNVEIEYPELLYFRMISNYLLRGRFNKPFQILDEYFYKFYTFRRCSYSQYIYLS